MLKYLYIHFMQLNKNFKRTLGLYTAISLVIGSVIGSGILCVLQKWLCYWIPH